MEKHKKAFDLVCPGVAAQRLAAVGLVSSDDAAGKTWRDPIAALLTAEELETAGVDLVDVIDSVVFFTGSAPKVQVVKEVGGTPFVSWLPSKRPRGFLIMADGYRNGPCGP